MSLVHASKGWHGAPGVMAERACGLAFLGILALAFAASLAATIAWGSAMPDMAGLPMPGGWMLSAPWLPMCGQSWPAMAASFLAMWLAMMAAMMLPSLAPRLWRYRQALAAAGERHADGLAALAGIGYAMVWALIGAAVFVLGVAFAALALRLPAVAAAVPLAAGLIVLAAGLLQFTAWKARHLACWRHDRATPARPASVSAALLTGLRLGYHCGLSSAGPTVILLVTGMMDLRIMAAVTAAMLGERLAPDGRSAARIAGVSAIGFALLLIGQAVGLQ
jgi:predicted metal-binding membrane protein